MKAVLYLRVSSEDQNLDRQKAELMRFVKIREDITETIIVEEKASGAIPFRKRDIGKIFDMNDIALLVVHDIDRLGRDALDIMQTVKELHGHKINVAISKLGMETLLPDGTENPSAKIIISVMGTLAEMERNKIKERQKEGISIAKKKGRYKGRRKGTKATPKQVIDKYPKVVKELQTGRESYRRIAKLCSVSPVTVVKVAKALEEVA